MPRQGLTAERVLDSAAALADAEGLDAVTVARVAEALGVRAPSLYNHVAGRDGLARGVALRGVRELGDVLRAAATGRAGEDALLAVAHAYRTYAHTRPGRYAATLRAPAAGDDEHAAAARATVAVLLAVLRGWGLEGDAAVHAVRGLRSALHGFVALEAAGGFALDVDPDRSFTLLVRTLAAGLGDPR